MTHQTLEAALRKTLEQEFNNVEILDIKIEDDFDQDGEPVVNVKVIFDGNRKRLDSRRVAGFLRHVRSNLREDGIDDADTVFPIMSFISRSDWKGQIAEAG